MEGMPEFDGYGTCARLDARGAREDAMRLWREMGEVRKKKAPEIQWKAEGVRSFVLPWSADARCGGA
jgi:hypothetical protein